MNDDVCARMRAIELLAKGDEAYMAMLQELRVLEKRYESVLQSLPAAHQDILCDYLFLCEEISRRRLELACSYMRFPT